MTMGFFFLLGLFAQSAILFPFQYWALFALDSPRDNPWGVDRYDFGKH
jgi:hypothetical protein